MWKNSIIDNIVSRENQKDTRIFLEQQNKKEITDLRTPLHYKIKENFQSKFLKTRKMEKQT